MRRWELCAVDVFDRMMQPEGDDPAPRTRNLQAVEPQLEPWLKDGWQPWATVEISRQTGPLTHLIGYRVRLKRPVRRAWWPR